MFFKFKFKLIIKIALLCLILTGCAATQYQPKNSNGGYSHTQLSETKFQVNFQGNSYTSAELASDFAMLRCADLALENNYNHFLILNTQAQSKTESYFVPANTYTYSSGYSYTTGGYGGTSESPIATYTIELTENSDEKGAIDAEFLIRSIEDKYKHRKLFAELRAKEK